MVKRRNRPVRVLQSGFTLLEVILALSIVSVVSGIMYWFFWNTVSVTDREASQSRDVQLVRAVLDRLVREIRQSNGLAANHYGAGIIGRKDPRLGSAISINTVVLPDKNLMYPRSITDQQDVGQFDLQEVKYYIGWDEENTDEDGEPRPLGLIRRVSKTFLREVVIEGDEEGDAGDKETTVAVKEELYAPEIKYIEFKYFDGTSWWDDWEVTQGNSLPQIIRVTVGFEPVPPSEAEANFMEDDFLCDEAELKPLAADRFAVFVRLVRADTFFGSRLTREASALSSSESKGF